MNDLHNEPAPGSLVGIERVADPEPGIDGGTWLLTFDSPASADAFLDRFARSGEAAELARNAYPTAGDEPAPDPAHPEDPQNDDIAHPAWA